MTDFTSFVHTLLPFELFSFSFMRHAFIALVLLTPLLGLLGTMAVNQKMAFFSDALGHSALTGIGLGVLLNLNELVAMLVFGIVWALLINRIKQSGRTSTDTVISVFSSTSIALGLVILSSGGGFAKYSSLLIGDVLAISTGDIVGLGIALVVGVALWTIIYNALLLTSINGALARSRGIATKWIEALFMVMIALCVMVAIRWIGILLINALLIVPAAAGRNLAKSTKGHALYSVIIALTSGIAGLVFSYYFNTSTGAAVVLFAAVWYGVSLVVALIQNKRKVVKTIS